MVTLIIAIAVLLILSAFFSGSETALTGASRALMHHLEGQGDRRARLVNRLIERKGRLLGAILIGNNLVNILASALATSAFLVFFGDAGIAYATLIMTALVVLFAEILPKTYALHNADRMAIVIAPVIRLVVVVLAPFCERGTGHRPVNPARIRGQAQPRPIVLLQDRDAARRHRPASGRRGSHRA